ncbi:MAG: flagellar hook-basal body complex protein FliE [Spirochaetota bacterium]
MAISGIGNTGVDLAALARSNSLQYTGGSSLSALTGGAATGADTISIDGIGADTLGLSAAQLGLARQSGASAASAFSVGRVSAAAPANFEDALLKAIDGVNADQQKTSNLIQQMVVAPDSVNAHDVTIAMAESNLSLNLARTILDRITRGWKEIINIR